MIEDIATRMADVLRIDVAWIYAAWLVFAGVFVGWALRKIMLEFGVPLALRTRTDFDDLFLRTTATPVAVAAGFIGIVAALRVLLQHTDRDAWLAPLLPTGLLVIFGAAGAQLAAHALLHGARRLPGSHRIRGAVILGRLIKVAVGVIVLLSLLSVWNVSITPILASAGIVGIALALAAQDTLANFFAGVAVYVDRLYEVGDFVVLDQGGGGEIRGEVRDIGLRSTRILTLDDVLVTVPNSIIANGRVVNESGNSPQYRVRITVGVAYESDLEQVERVLIRAADGAALVLPDPAPRVRYRAFADSSVAVDLLVWIRDPRDRGNITHELMKKVHKLFEEERIRIPFPQQDVHLFSGEARAPVHRE